MLLYSEKYSIEAKVFSRRFEEEYLTRAGRVASYSQTGYALAIVLPFGWCERLALARK
jgi:hypothetical protein